MPRVTISTKTQYSGSKIETADERDKGDHTESWKFERYNCTKRRCWSPASLPSSARAEDTSRRGQEGRCEGQPCFGLLDVVASFHSTSAVFWNNFQRTHSGPEFVLRHLCFAFWGLLVHLGNHIPHAQNWHPIRNARFTNCKESGTILAWQKNTRCLTSTLIPTNCREHLNWPHRGPLKSVSIQLASQSIPQEYEGCSLELQSNPSVRLIRFFSLKNPTQVIDLGIENSIDVQ